MKTILGIGGSVIKTAYDEIRELARRKHIDVLVVNGGALFHDFQRSTEKMDSPSYSLDDLLANYNLDEPASKLVWHWLRGGSFPPDGSLLKICSDNEIDVLLFTAPGADFFHLFGNAKDWESLGRTMFYDYKLLCNHMRTTFHYINMGSAVILPEVFIKAVAQVKPEKFTTTVVDFLPNQYRPLTRVAKYGSYVCSDHKQFLSRWLELGKAPS